MDIGTHYYYYKSKDLSDASQKVAGATVIKVGDDPFWRGVYTGPGTSPFQGATP